MIDHDMISTCSHCDNRLVPRTESIPESIICYPAGTADPDRPGNRIVEEMVCPIHGVVYSPGGGVCSTVSLLGGPWDGRQKLWGGGTVQEVIVNGEKHKYQRLSDEPFIFEWVPPNATSWGLCYYCGKEVMPDVDNSRFHIDGMNKPESPVHNKCYNEHYEKVKS